MDEKSVSSLLLRSAKEKGYGGQAGGRRLLSFMAKPSRRVVFLGKDALVTIRTVLSVLSSVASDQF